MLFQKLFINSYLLLATTEQGFLWSIIPRIVLVLFIINNLYYNGIQNIPVQTY